MGPRYGRRVRSVNRLRWLRMVCVDIGALWRFCVPATVLWMVFTDFTGVWGEYGNPLTTWFLRVVYYVDGSRWSQSLVCDVSTKELLCVAHWNVWHHLQSPRWFAAYSLSFLCRRWWGLSKLFFVGMKCFCNAQVTIDYRRSDGGLINPTSENVQFWVNFIKIALSMFGSSDIVKNIDNERKGNEQCLLRRWKFSSAPLWSYTKRKKR